MSKLSLKKKLILVTGFSGAGHSTALKILEDYGYTAVDNLPLALVDPLVALEVETSGRFIAIGLDVRTTGFGAEAVARLVQNLSKRFGSGFKMLFISAVHGDLMRRYNATRRQHPLGNGLDLAAAVRADMERMSDVEILADFVIDSSGLAPADLRQAILDSLKFDAVIPMSINVLSFSYRYGLPEMADHIIDVRFVKNPHWDENLRNLDGLDKAVGTFLSQDEVAIKVLCQFQQTLKLTLYRIKAEGRPNFTLAFGCTGGKHRSVWAAAKVAKWIEVQGYQVRLSHRDLNQSNR